ncbi:MAG: cytochrome d ubiquinol oxidase subunit II [Gemmataceae bacterium]
METFWFLLFGVILIAYVVLDGFDLGVGIVSPWIAKTPEERLLVGRTIHPVWGANEVWLLAAGGALYFAFPLVYASSFSGFYLALMITLWLLILRGLGIELRGHIDDPLWHSLCDFSFSTASLLLAFFYGVAMGNVLRGVPLQADGYFFVPLWTDFGVGPHPGILDWYTTLTGLLAFAALTVHGASYVALKTVGAVRDNARRLVSRGCLALAVLAGAGLVATLYVRPGAAEGLERRPWGWSIPVFAALALGGIWWYRRKGNDLAAFLSSSAFLVMMMAGAFFAIYPALLPDSASPGRSLTIYNTRTGDYSMQAGLVWWALGSLLALGYFTFLYRSFRGKVTADE